MQVERFTKQELLEGEKFLEKEVAVLDGDLEYGLRSFGKGFTVLEGSILKEERVRVSPPSTPPPTGPPTISGMAGSVAGCAIV